jgi:hypothetical protein
MARPSETCSIGKKYLQNISYFKIETDVSDSAALPPRPVKIVNFTRIVICTEDYAHSA